MLDLPLGAAQQHGVEASLQTFEGIVGIEFIEINDDIPYPRSSAYRRCKDGAEMRIRNQSFEIDEVALAADEARAFIDRLVNAGMFRLHRVYRPSQGTFVLAGTQWRLEVTFAQTEGQSAPRPFKSEGEGLFPDCYELLCSILMLKDAG